MYQTAHELARLCSLHLLILLDYDSERAPQSDIQSVGEHDEARGNFLAIGQCQFLPLGAGGNARDLRPHPFDAIRDFGPDGVDEVAIHDAELLARLFVEQNAEARDPVFAVVGG